MVQLTWGHFQRVLLALVIVTSFLTIVAVNYSLISQALFDLLIAIQGVMIADMILYEVRRASEETKLKVIKHSKGMKIGFSVESENKTIKNAFPMCNGARYPWEDDDGTTNSQKDLYVNAPPAHFYPFVVRTERRVGETWERIAVTVNEVHGNTRLYLDEFEIMRGEIGNWANTTDPPSMPFSASMRIVGEGNETKKDYKMKLVIPTVQLSKGFPDVEDIEAYFDLEEVKPKPFLRRILTVGD